MSEIVRTLPDEFEYIPKMDAWLLTTGGNDHWVKRDADGTYRHFVLVESKGHPTRAAAEAQACSLMEAIAKGRSNE